MGEGTTIEYLSLYTFCSAERGPGDGERTAGGWIPP